jgi:hypothetical protein
MRYLVSIFLLRASQLYGQSTDTGSLGWNQRWDNYIERTYNWKRVGIVAVETAFDQTFQLNKCRRPPYCFPHEFSGALARRTARTTIELGAGALLREDIRRSPSNLTGFRQRLRFALIHAPMAKDLRGDWRPAYSRFAGTLGGAAVSSAWSGRPISADRLFQTFGWSFTSYFEDALWAEFEPDVKRIGSRFTHKFGHRDRVPIVMRRKPTGCPL